MAELTMQAHREGPCYCLHMATSAFHRPLLHTVVLSSCITTTARGPFTKALVGHHETRIAKNITEKKCLPIATMQQQSHKKTKDEEKEPLSLHGTLCFHVGPSRSLLRLRVLPPVSSSVQVPHALPPLLLLMHTATSWPWSSTDLVITKELGDMPP